MFANLAGLDIQAGTDHVPLKTVLTMFRVFWRTLIDFETDSSSRGCALFSMSANLSSGGALRMQKLSPRPHPYPHPRSHLVHHPFSRESRTITGELFLTLDMSEDSIKCFTYCQELYFITDAFPVRSTLFLPVLVKHKLMCNMNQIFTCVLINFVYPRY